MKIRIKEIAEMRGFKTAYELSERAGLSYPTADRAFNNKIKQFTPDTLERLCKTLFCTPNDIFGIDAAIEYPPLTGEKSISPEQWRRLSKAAQKQHEKNFKRLAVKQKNGERKNQDGSYFVNDTGKTILQLLDEAKEKTRQEIEEQCAERIREFPNIYKYPDSLDRLMKRSLKNPLMTRIWNIGYGEENKRGERRRLVHLEGAGWLTDEDLAALDPDEQVQDFDKMENVRLGDLQIYKSARRKAGLPPLAEEKAVK